MYVRTRVATATKIHHPAKPTHSPSSGSRLTSNEKSEEDAVAPPSVLRPPFPFIFLEPGCVLVVDDDPEVLLLPVVPDEVDPEVEEVDPVVVDPEVDDPEVDVVVVVDVEPDPLLDRDLSDGVGSPPLLPPSDVGVISGTV